jgi:hypothetical protein
MIEKKKEEDKTYKERQSDQIKKDIEVFLANGGVIQDCKTSELERPNTVNVKYSTTR